jgi:hypothetical protein
MNAHFTDPHMNAIARSLADLLAQEPDAMAAVFTPSPLDLLNLAELRRDHPEYALELAAAAGRAFDEEHK